MLWNSTIRGILRAKVSSRSSKSMNLKMYMAETKKLDEVSVNELHRFFTKVEEGVPDFSAYLKSYK